MPSHPKQPLSRAALPPGGSRAWSGLEIVCLTDAFNDTKETYSHYGYWRAASIPAPAREEGVWSAAHHRPPFFAARLVPMFEGNAARRRSPRQRQGPGSMPEAAVSLPLLPYAVSICGLDEICTFAEIRGDACRVHPGSRLGRSRRFRTISRLPARSVPLPRHHRRAGRQGWRPSPPTSSGCWASAGGCEVSRCGTCLSTAMPGCRVPPPPPPSFCPSSIRGREDEAFREVARVREWNWPNSRMIEMAGPASGSRRPAGGGAATAPPAHDRPQAPAKCHDADGANANANTAWPAGRRGERRVRGGQFELG